MLLGDFHRTPLGLHLNVSDTRSPFTSLLALIQGMAAITAHAAHEDEDIFLGESIYIWYINMALNRFVRAGRYLSIDSSGVFKTRQILFWQSCPLGKQFYPSCWRLKHVRVDVRKILYFVVSCPATCDSVHSTYFAENFFKSDSFILKVIFILKPLKILRKKFIPWVRFEPPSVPSLN